MKTHELATRAVLGLVFCAFAFWGNYQNFGVVAGTYHFFGSIGVWAALATLGPRWGLLTALIGAAPAATSLGSWPVALLFFLELLFVVVLTSRVRILASRITACVLIYWIVFGIPASFLVTTIWGDGEWIFAISVSLYFALNGVLNAMIAALLVNTLIIVRPNFPVAEHSKRNNSYTNILQAGIGLLILVPIMTVGFLVFRQEFSLIGQGAEDDCVCINCFCHGGLDIFAGSKGSHVSFLDMLLWYKAVLSESTWADGSTLIQRDMVISQHEKVTRLLHNWLRFLALVFYLMMVIVVGGQLIYFLFRRWIERFALIAENSLREGTSSNTVLNENFYEDRQISIWLGRFGQAVQNAERGATRAQYNFDALITKASSPILAINDYDQVIEWNPALCALTGYSRQETLGKSLSDMVESQSSKFAQSFGGDPADLVLDIRAKNGKLMHLVASQLPIVSEGQSDEVENVQQNKKYYIARNVSELRDSQAKLIQASRLAALGEMASSFAHELNQPLNIISMSAGNFLERAGTADLPLEYAIQKMQRVEKQALRAGKVIQGIRKFVLEIGDQGETQFDPIARTRSAIDLLQEQLRLDSISIVLDYDHDDLRLSGRPILFEQTMLNLITNSRQAMRNQSNLDRLLCIRFVVEADLLIITVDDTGPGIPTHLKDRVFDAFFSTKVHENGTGIGLYLSRTVVEAMDGEIRALDCDVGTCIEIRFPVTRSLGSIP